MPDFMAKLLVNETVRISPEILEKLTHQFGPLGAEQVITSGAEKSTVYMRALQHAVDRDDHADALDIATQLIKLTRHIGMSSYADTAGLVCHCLKSGDQIAIMATMARLHRIGDKSLMAVWGLEEELI